MNANNQPIRIRLYGVDDTQHNPEALDQLTTALWRELDAQLEGESRLVQEERLPEGAKVAAVGIVGGLIVEQIVVRSIDQIVSILFDFVRGWLRNREEGNLRAKIQVGTQLIDLSPTMQKSEIEAQVRQLKLKKSGNGAEGKRLALIVGNNTYTDTKLTRLNAPQMDAKELAEALEDDNIGGFDDVQVLFNESSSQVKQSIELLFRERNRDDLLFLYFSGHGIKDERGNLFLATSDTRHDFARSTGISANFIKDSMENSFSRRKVLVLDCCYSGAFVQGAKSAAALGSRINASRVFSGSGYGQVVVTASDTMQYAWEGNKIIGDTDNSFFTHYLIEGLRTGKADADKDGRISVAELYSYVYDKVIGRQTPSISSTEMEGKIFLARNPHPVARPDLLPHGLLEALESTHSWQREGAIIGLSQLLDSNDPLKANTARFYLEKLVNDDSRKVSLAAQRALSITGHEERTSPPLQPPSRPVPSEPGQVHREPDSNHETARQRGKNSFQALAPNTSGQGKLAEIPEEIKGKWNWGAFLLSGIWGMGNNAWIALALALIATPFLFFFPLVSIGAFLFLGWKGNEWAWRSKQWDSVEHFQKVQKKWKKWGFTMIGVFGVLFLFLMVIIIIIGAFA